MPGLPAPWFGEFCTGEVDTSRVMVKVPEGRAEHDLYEQQRWGNRDIVIFDEVLGLGARLPRLVSRPR